MFRNSKGPAAEAPGSLHYSSDDRRADYKKGQADGRKEIPTVPRHPSAPDDYDALLNPEPAAISTPLLDELPFLKELYHMRNQDINRLKTDYLSERVQLRKRLRSAEAAIERLRDQHASAAKAQQQLADSPFTEQEATRRHYGEQDQPDSLIRRRRERDRRGRQADADERLATIASQLETASVAAQDAREELANQLQVAQGKAEQIVHYYKRRQAAYLSGLTHGHRNGPELLRLLEPDGQDLPGWLSWEDDGQEDT